MVWLTPGARAKTVVAGCEYDLAKKTDNAVKYLQPIYGWDPMGLDELEYYRTLFEYAPISLWEEDYSGILQRFKELRSQGVQSLAPYLDEHPEFVDACMSTIIVNRVNQQTLRMFKAASQEECLANLPSIFRDGMRHHMRSELLALWNGDLEWYGDGVNYTLEGHPVDILLHWRILPGFEQNWQRVLVTIEDITARKRAERRLQNLFEASPISLWEEDYSAVKAYFDSLRAQGVTDLQNYLDQHPEAVAYCMKLIRVLSVNQKTLVLFGAKSQEHLIANLDKIFRDDMEIHFARELIDLWNGRLIYEREGINYTLSGEPINIALSLRVMPEHEEDFSWILVAIQDVTARKKAEEYLHYLGTHDVLTGLYNRTFFQDALQQLEKERHEPISLIVADLDYLKATNDSFGHQAGDNLIRRAAEVLKASLGTETSSYFAARIGGDEFVLVLSNTDASKAAEVIKQLRRLVDLNNQYYRQPLLSLSLGTATSQPGVPLEKVFSIADNAMYADKATHRH